MEHALDCGPGAVDAENRPAGRELLRVRNLVTTFSSHKTKVEAVRGVDISVYEGDFLALVGESGSGKSVTMKSVMGLLPNNADCTADELVFDGRNLLECTDRQRRELRGGGIAMIFQDPMTSLDPLQTVGSHLREVLRRHRHMTGTAADDEAVRVLSQVGIPSPEERLSQYPHEFSGGMRQRVLIAMALSCKPRLLIADEPTTALDVTIQAQILDLLARLRDEEGMSIVLITHDLGVVASMCNRVSVMYGGLIMEQGTVDDIYYRPRHPYTRALLGAVPNPNGRREGRLVATPGPAPSLANPPAGCPFGPRCSQRVEACGTQMPPMHDFGSGQLARCLRLLKNSGGVDQGGAGR